MQSPSLFPRTFGKRSYFKGAYKSRMLNIFKLKTLLKLHLERSFQACDVDIKVATTRRFVATYIHRVYPGRDSPPVYRDLSTKYKLYLKRRVESLCFFSAFFVRADHQLWFATEGYGLHFQLKSKSTTHTC